MEEKKKSKLVKISDIIVIIIGVVILIYGLSCTNKNNNDSWSGGYHIGDMARAKEEQEEEIKMQNIIIITGFAVTAFGVACIIKRVLDKKDNKLDKSDNSTSTKMKELQKMLNDKTITEEEFENKKQELLKKM